MQGSLTAIGVWRNAMTMDKYAVMGVFNSPAAVSVSSFTLAHSLYKLIGLISWLEHELLKF